MDCYCEIATWTIAQYDQEFLAQRQNVPTKEVVSSFEVERPWYHQEGESEERQQTEEENGGCC